MAATWREILYDVVFVAMRYTQLDAVMDTLKVPYRRYILKDAKLHEKGTGIV